MRFSRSVRRVPLTVLRGALLAGAATVLLALAPSAAHAVGSDDYPAKLKSATQDSLVDPWFFYNRECTSFVAWRLNHDSGIPFTNKYLGEHWGDARIWKQAAVASGVTVDNSPVVGAVAWWSAGSVGSSRGHVAYVEKVTPSSIVIEEYNYLRRGYYDTRTLPVTSGSWPSGFIHVGDTALSNIAPPTVAGTARVGEQLTASQGRWTPSGAKYRYQWLAGGQPIPGATSRSYVPSAAQVARRVQVQVTATRAGVSPATAVSSTTPKVAKGLFSTTAAPTVIGTPQVGVPLLATTGTWSPGGSYTFQWSVGGAPVSGATGMSYTPLPADLGKPVTVTVTAALDGYNTARSTSAATPAVIAGDFANPMLPWIDGTPQVDHSLYGRIGQWTPRGRFHYQWFANGAPIAGATHQPYTPTPATVDQVLTFEVTVTATGYNDAAATSLASAPVLRGTFTEVKPPTVTGTPRVDVPLTAAPGSWTPKPSALQYQWLADGVPIPGATGLRFTPTPEQFGKQLTFQAMAVRDGYTNGLDTSVATAPVAPGHVTNTTRPTVTGTAFLGRVLRASAGSWSVPSDEVGYQWLRDGLPIADATEPTYTLAEDDVAHRIAVRVTSSTFGYDPATAASTATARVLRGVTGVTGPIRVAGTPLLGHAVRVPQLHTTPADATQRYQWYRGTQRIRGATGQRYVVQPADLGHRLRVQVSLTASQWVGHTTLSTWTVRAAERPRVRAVARRTGRSVAVEASVVTQFAPHAHGTITISDARRTVGTLGIRRGVGQLTVTVPRRWTTLTLVWNGTSRVAARTVTVRIR